MISVRYRTGKVWVNFVCAFVGGLVIVIALGAIIGSSARVGGIAGLVAVLVMLLPGVIKRGARAEPVLTIGDDGGTVHLLDVGTIPWRGIRAARVTGVPWVTGQRLILEYAGTPPKVGFGAKLNWGIQAKQTGDMVRLTLGFLDLTDQSKSNLEAALSRQSAAPAR